MSKLNSWFSSLTIKKKLNVSFIILLSLIVFTLAGTQIIMQLYNDTTNQLVEEFHEQNALHKLRISLDELNLILLVMNDEERTFSTEPFKNVRSDIMLNQSIVTSSITERHSHQYRHLVNQIVEALDFFLNSVKTGMDLNFQDELKTELTSKILLGKESIDELILEVHEEIAEIEARVHIIERHGKNTMLVFGFVMILFLMITGRRLAKNIIIPIQQLVSSTKKISSGNRSERISMDTRDEFNILAMAFNEMLDTLYKTSYSESYFKGIINNLYGALLVINEAGLISNVNSTVTKMLGYREDELVGKRIDVLFGNPDLKVNVEDIEGSIRQITAEKYMLTNDGKMIPVYITCTLLQNTDSSEKGLILVAHNETEKKEYEARIEQSRKERLIAINDAQEEERMRLAIDLHDGLGQMLTATYYAANEMEAKDTQQKKVLEKLRNLIDASILETKSIARDLIPITLKDFGLVKALENLFERISQNSKTKFRFSFYDFPDKIDPRLEKALFRICQESANNILKHASATEATIELFGSEVQIVLVIEDNGKGFNTADLDSVDLKKGIGLISIRERVHTFGGLFTLNSQAGRGTEILIEIPLKVNNHG